MITPILFFIVGLVLLVKGADWLVDGASSVAKKLKVSDLVIGLTIVAFGTSAPELVVSVISNLNGNADIAIGNVLGSNIANILLILGVSSIIYPLSVTRGTVWKEIPLSLLAVILLGIMANDVLIDGAANSSLTRTDGLALIAFFIIFLYYTFGIAKNGNCQPEQGEEVKEIAISKSIIYIFAGLISLVIGGKWVVDSAVSIATSLGVSEALIGLTIVAVGTSLPELATSAMATYKKKADIAIGNVVGSNIFNVFWILGLSSIINPLPFRPEGNFDIMIAIFASLLLFIMMFVGKRHHLERRDGVIYIFVYVIYIAALVARG